MNLITTQKALRQAITNVKAKITDTELFLSSAYLTFLKNMIDGVTKRFEQPVLLDISEKDEHVTACTDGNKIYVNINNSAIRNLDRKKKHSAIIATVLHECAHILFTDFKLAFAAYKKLSEENILYPQPTTCDEAKKFSIWLLTTGTGKDLIKLYQAIDNCIEDGYVDNRIISYIPGYGQNRIWYKGILSTDIPSYEEMIANPNMDSITTIINLVLTYAKFGILKYDKDVSSNDELIKIFFSMKIHIDEAIKENNSFERRRIINHVFSCMFSIIENEWNKQQQHNNSQNNKSSAGNNSSNSNDTTGSTDSSSDNSPTNSSDGSQSSSEFQKGNSSSSDETGLQNQIQASMTAENFLQAISNASNTIEQGQDNTHSNTQVLKTPSFSQSQAASNSDDASNMQNNTDESISSNSDLDQILNQAAKDCVAKEQENELERQLNKELSSISSTKYHKNVKSSIDRVSLTSRGIQRYEDMHTELDAIARRLVKNLDKEIRERKLGDTLNGLYMGKRLDNRSLYRKDKKIFTKKIQPEHIPDMEISLLVDLSGSMGGERISTSMKATYILYAFANILHIPVSVYGHHVNGHVKMHSYTNSTSLDGLDKKRIFEMSSGGCNRDGYALRFCLNKLQQSDATTKIMLIISDGCPNDSGYHFEEAKIDIQEAVAEAKKHGVITITAAIGDDCSNIKALYTDGISEKKAAIYLDISELERLPKLFPNIIKKYLL